MLLIAFVDRVLGSISIDKLHTPHLFSVHCIKLYNQVLRIIKLRSKSDVKTGHI